MASKDEKVLSMSDYGHQVEVYERQRKIYDDSMRLWDTFNSTAAEMDARFDKALFTVAAGSFGISFAFIDKIVPVAKAANPVLIVVSWACFAACLIITVLGHLLSANAYRKHRDNTTKEMYAQIDGVPIETKRIRNFVSPCNYLAIISYAGGIVCLLLFVLLNL
ncbi:hypothetical protein FACS1894109_11180 [Spirochaetia bacterium]|nr:hypothetical protein FACS1894109_11180 [Spirochaetia bacterium]